MVEVWYLTRILANFFNFQWVDFEISSFLYIVYESQQNKRSYIFP